jgi:high-affinity K+ transport system ATPase subunit B
VPDPGGAHGASEILVAKSGLLLGSILVADHLRPEAIESVKLLKQMGLKTVADYGRRQACRSGDGRCPER